MQLREYVTNKKKDLDALTRLAKRDPSLEVVDSVEFVTGDLTRARKAVLASNTVSGVRVYEIQLMAEIRVNGRRRPLYCINTDVQALLRISYFEPEDQVDEGLARTVLQTCRDYGVRENVVSQVERLIATANALQKKRVTVPSETPYA